MPRRTHRGAGAGRQVSLGALWGATYPSYYNASTLSHIDPALASVPIATNYGPATCPAPWSPSTAVWPQDPACAAAAWELDVTVGYGTAAAPAFSPLQTANVPVLDPPPPYWGGINEGGYYFVRFAADRTVCVAASDNQAVAWGRGLNNSEVLCQGVRLRGPPLFVGQTGQSLDSPFVFLDAHQLWAGIRTLPALVGTPVAYTMRARDPNPEDTVGQRCACVCGSA